MPFLSSTDKVDQLLRQCTGQQVKIPFLYSLFPAWQAHFNPSDDPSTEDELCAFQKRWIKNPIALKRNRGIDPIFFSRSVFPEAGLENLNIAVVWLSWLYYWDDALDFGELDTQPDRLDQYERELFSSIQRSLLGEGGLDEDPSSSAPTCVAAQAWYKIGVRIRHRVNSASSRNFMYECLRDYIAATIELQKQCDKAAILDIESYLAIRMNTSAVYPTISMYLLTSQSDPPEWFLSHSLVKEALYHINIIVSLCNDIVSARHEIESGHVDNIIPLLIYHKGLSAQGALDEAVQMMQTSFLAFRSLEVQLNALGQEHNISEDVDAFLNGCINLCMGAIQWTYHIKRYFDYTPSWGSADMSVVLGCPSKNQSTSSWDYFTGFRALFERLVSTLL